MFYNLPEYGRRTRRPRVVSYSLLGVMLLAGAGLVNGFILLNDPSERGELTILQMSALGFAGPALLGLASFWTLRGHSWARAFFLVVAAVYGAGLVAWEPGPFFIAEVVLLVVFAALLSTRKAREYFAGKRRSHRRRAKDACVTSPLSLNSEP